MTLAWEFEPCWAFNEPAQIIEIAHQLAGPGFGVLYDTAHAHTVAEVGARQVEGGPLAGGQLELLRELEGTIVHVHLLDSDGTHPRVRGHHRADDGARAVRRAARSTSTRSRTELPADRVVDGRPLLLAGRVGGDGGVEAVRRRADRPHGAGIEHTFGFSGRPTT